MEEFKTTGGVPAFLRSGKTCENRALKPFFEKKRIKIDPRHPDPMIANLVPPGAPRAPAAR